MQEAHKKATKDLCLIAVSTAMLIGVQYALSFIPGMEVVTVMLAALAASFGIKKGVIIAVAFSLLRCILFGFFPSVVLLYLIYYPLFALIMALIGKIRKGQAVVAVIFGVIMTGCFVLLDDVITPLFFGYTKEASVAYFYASLPVLWTQLISSAVTMTTLFYPLRKLLTLASRNGL